MKNMTADQAKNFLRQSLPNKLSLFVRQSFLTVDPGAHYLHNWHIDCISEYLEACYRKEIKRLIINIPPRYMKSISVSVAWPAWILGKDPSERIMSSSYSQTLATKHSLDCRKIIQSQWYQEVFPEVKLAQDQNEKMKFETTKMGHRISTSVGGGSTGLGGNFIICDDPHNPLQAVSPKRRETALEWFDQTLMSRFDDKKTGVCVVVMQRLHQQDLTGHLMEKGGWENLSIPAIGEEKKVYSIGGFKHTRENGELLHEEREGKFELDRMKLSLGNYGWSGQYQQRPAPLGGGIFKKDWLRYFTTERKYSQIVMSWDTAYKPGEHNDPSACGVFGVHPHGYDLLFVYRGRLEYPALKVKARELGNLWSRADLYERNPIFTILIEDKASGQSLIPDLRQETSFNIVAIKPQNDKLTRAHVVTPQFEAGKVFLRKDAHWLEDYEDELLTFDNGTHDDQVDMTTQFLNWISVPKSGNITEDMLDTNVESMLDTNEYTVNNYDQNEW